MNGAGAVVNLVRRGIRANLGRLALTLISVFLGVAFVSGSFVLADSLRSIFNQISEDSFAGVDAQVRALQGDLGSAEVLPRFPDDIVADLQALPEVDYAEGGLFAFEQAYTLDADGEPVRPQGPPVFVSSWGGPSPVSAFRMLDGEPPSGTQVALDQIQADAGGFAVGDEIMVATPAGEITSYELSGIIDFGEGGTAGAYFLIFDLPTAQQVLALDGQIDSIVINGGDTPNADLLDAVGAALPEELEVVSGEVVIQEQKDTFGGFIDIFGNVLLGFAVVVLFVSTFIIYNTFAILVGQRTRQLGLLRSIGASGPQVRWMVLIEALVVGIIASTAGLLGGLGVAWLLKTLFDQAGGGGFPDGPLRLLPRTILVSLLVGLIVTMLSALIPAVRASRVSPLDALRDAGGHERSLRFRLIAGGAVLVPGLIALLTGMFAQVDSTSGRLTLIGVGGALTFIGVAMLSALFAGPVANVLAAPVEQLKGVTGRIARDNTVRNPQRTAATATALMIGLALITGVAVLTTSLLATLDELLEDSITADLFVFEENQNLPFTANVVDDLAALPEVNEVAGFTFVDVLIDGDSTSVAAYDSGAGDRVIDMGVTDGVIDDLGETGVALLDDEAADLDVGVGDTITVEFEDGFRSDLTVRAIYDNASATNSGILIDRELSRQHTVLDQIDRLGLTYVEGVQPEAARDAVEEALLSYPQLTAQDNSEFQEEVQGQVNQLQVIVTALLGLCLVVAFFGIVNTMALSVLERIREIGLLRAVGMTRSQLKSSIRWEAIVVSLFGALLGILMGLLLGAAAVIAIPDEFISAIGIPWLQLLVFLVVGVVIGVIAAYFPASRAAKLDVLDAIAYE